MAGTAILGIECSTDQIPHSRPALNFAPNMRVNCVYIIILPPSIGKRVGQNLPHSLPPRIANIGRNSKLSNRSIENKKQSAWMRFRVYVNFNARESLHLPPPWPPFRNRCQESASTSSFFVSLPHRPLSLVDSIIRTIQLYHSQDSLFWINTG